MRESHRERKWVDEVIGGAKKTQRRRKPPSTSKDGVRAKRRRWRR
jgi:hypothetical protein